MVNKVFLVQCRNHSELLAGNVFASLAANLLLVVTLSVLPLRVSASVGEHSDLKTLGELLTLTSDKRRLDTVLDVSADVISDCAASITILLSDTGITQGQCIGEFSKKVAAEVVVLVIVRSSRGALFCRPASVENQKGRHGQSLGVLGVREEHPTAIRELSVQSGDLVEVDDQVLGGVQLLLLVNHSAADDRHQGYRRKK